MAYFVAVDAGGTKTDYVLANETHTLSRVRGGSIKRLRVSAEEAAHNLASALDQLRAESGVNMAEISRCCVGTAGETVPLVTDWLRAEFARRVGGELILVGDVEIALDAAFQGGPGVLVLSGTGSNTAGRGPNGVITTAGGWGPALADQASGYRIGQEGLRAAFLALDQERPTTLLSAVMKFWELKQLEDVVERANSSPAPDFSQLAPLVARSADEGDAVAQEVLLAQGRDLGYVVRLLIRRLRRTSGDMSFLPKIAFAGSVMDRMFSVREAMLADVQAEFPDVIALAGVVDPVAGALWQARGKLL